MLAQTVLQLAEHIRRLIHAHAGFHHDMRHEHGHAGGHGARMQIMDGHDVRDILQMRTYFVEIQSVRGLLQQHFQRIAQQLHRT